MVSIKNQDCLPPGRTVSFMDIRSYSRIFWVDISHSAQQESLLTSFKNDWATILIDSDRVG